MEFKGYKSIKSDTAPCLTSHDGNGSEPVLFQELSLYSNNAQAGRVYDANGISPTLDTATGGNRMPKILTQVRSEEGRELRKIGIEKFSLKELRMRDDDKSNTITTFPHDNLLQEPCFLQRPHGYNKGGKIIGIAPTVTTARWEDNNLLKEPQKKLCLSELPDKTLLEDKNGKGYIWQDNGLWRIRKLTEREVYRLQDVSEDDIDTLLATDIAKSRHYMLAGNSITVSVLYHIFRKLFIDKETDDLQMTLF